MKITLFALFGLAFLIPTGSEGQESTATISPGYGVQSSAARNQKLADQEMKMAVQQAREMNGLRYSSAVQPIAPIPMVPEMDSDLEQVTPSRSYGPAPEAPRPPSSPNAAAVEQALLEATGQPPVEPPSNGKSGNLFSKLFGRKKDRELEPVEDDAPSGASRYQYPEVSPYVGSHLERSQSAPDVPVSPVVSPQEGGSSIFLNRRGSSSAGGANSVRYQVGVDVNGVHVILPKGSRVTILDERDGNARIRIADGRIGTVSRSAIE